MAMTGPELMEYMEKQRIKKGFKDDWEMFATAMNWKEVFGEEIPLDYYHPRDHHILDNEILGLTAHLHN